MQLGNTSSPHGQERVVGQAVLDWLKQYEIYGHTAVHYRAKRQRGCHDSRAAAMAKPYFQRTHGYRSELPPDASDDAKKLETAWVEGDMLFGKGMINDKAQLCAFMIAMSAR